jgi:hypothetical protein
MKAPTASSARSRTALRASALVALGACLSIAPGGARENGPPAPAADRAPPGPPDTYLLQSPGASVPRDPGAHIPGSLAELKPYPPGQPGDRTPFDLWRYAGRGDSSWAPPDLGTSWDKWLAKCQKQKPKLMAECKTYMDGRYDFHGRAVPGARMSGGKPVMAGPVARRPGRVSSFEELARMSPEEIRKGDLFPYKPLAHPLQTTAHMIFPPHWVRAHPEHERIDVDFDIPEPYLPEFPPPMFLTTHKELGDVTRGREVTLGNYFEMFNGLLTPEQMEGLKELLRPTPRRGSTTPNTASPSSPAPGSRASRATSTATPTGPSNWPRTPGRTRPGSAWTPRPCAATTTSCSSPRSARSAARTTSPKWRSTSTATRG